MKPLQFMIFSILFSLQIQAAEINHELDSLAHEWAHVNYELTAQEQEKGISKLLAHADVALKEYPNSADILIWHGIINSTYAGIEGGIGALVYISQAKDDLERALEFDPLSLEGSAYTSLGILYHKVPGWPISFGDDDTAEELLLRALEINSNGIDPNYFYADFLYDEGRYEESKMYLNRALDAKPRSNRQLADKGRLEEAHALFDRVLQELSQ